MPNNGDLGILIEPRDVIFGAKHLRVSIVKADSTKPNGHIYLGSNIFDGGGFDRRYSDNYTYTGIKDDHLRVGVDKPMGGENPTENRLIWLPGISEENLLNRALTAIEYIDSQNLVYEATPNNFVTVGTRENYPNEIHTYNSNSVAHSMIYALLIDQPGWSATDISNLISQIIKDLSITGAPGIEFSIIPENGSWTPKGNGLDFSVTGTAASEIIYGGDGSDTVDGGGGDDTLIGRSGDDLLYGGAGNDVVSYSSLLLDPPKDIKLVNVRMDTANTLHDNHLAITGPSIKIDFSYATADYIDVNGRQSDVDRLYGVEGIEGDSKGKNTIIGATSVDEGGLGGKGWSTIHYGTGQTVRVRYANVITGTDSGNNIHGNDSIHGSAGDDGFDGEDTINGLGGNDTLYGGTGDDVLSGGGDVDVFKNDGGIDRIADHESGELVYLNGNLLNNQTLTGDKDHPGTYKDHFGNEYHFYNNNQLEISHGLDDGYRLNATAGDLGCRHVKPGLSLGFAPISSLVSVADMGYHSARANVSALA